MPADPMRPMTSFGLHGCLAGGSSTGAPGMGRWIAAAPSRNPAPKASAIHPASAARLTRLISGSASRSRAAGPTPSWAGHLRNVHGRHAEPQVQAEEAALPRGLLQEERIEAERAPRAAGAAHREEST